MLSSYVKRVSKIIKKKYIMFIDESGRADINHEDPFTLTGVIFEYKYAVSQGDYFFLPAIVRFGPLRVRALFLVF